MTVEHAAGASGEPAGTGLDLGRVGIWQYQLDFVPSARSQEIAAEIEALGYGAVWMPEMIGRDPFVHSTLLLSATEHLVVGTGVAGIYGRDPLSTNSAVNTVTEAFPDRFVMGMGVSHQVMVEGIRGHEYVKPYSTMVSYLDAMDAGMFTGSPPTTPPRRLLGALGPRMLRLAAERTDGAHPYLVPVEHTAFAREQMGPEPLLCPEVTVVLDSDPTTARGVAREWLTGYLALPNYTNNLERFGWTASDMAGGGSDALVDAVVAWGDEAAIAERVAAHHAAGADHVCIQVLPAEPTRVPLDDWRRLAPALIG